MLKVKHEIDDPDRDWSLFPLCLLSIAPDIYDNKQKNNKQVDFFQDSASITPFQNLIPSSQHKQCRVSTTYIQATA